MVKLWPLQSVQLSGDAGQLFLRRYQTALTTNSRKMRRNNANGGRLQDANRCWLPHQTCRQSFARSVFLLCRQFTEQLTMIVCQAVGSLTKVGVLPYEGSYS